MNKNYIVSEERLRELLSAELQLQMLEAGGVDNWEWYGENRQLFLLDCINNRVSEEEIPDRINEDFIVDLDIKNYEEF